MTVATMSTPQKRWSSAKIASVLKEADYLATCPTGDPWAAIRMKERMKELAQIVRQLRGR